MRHTAKIGALLGALTLTVGACGGQAAAPSAATPSAATPSAATPPTPVRFMVANPVINLGHVHLGVAQGQGYYKEANVEVSYLTSPGTVAVVQGVAAGNADMGQADTLALDAAVAQGVSEVKAVCSYVANNIYYLVVAEVSTIQSAADPVCATRTRET